MAFVQATEHGWPSQTVTDQEVSSAGCGLDVPQNGEDPAGNMLPKKRGHLKSSAAPGTKACREKIRRDRLNDRFLELCSITEPGKKPQNINKVRILTDAACLLNQLRLEAKELREKRESLQDRINSQKAEKMELREEKLALKAEKERLEQLVKGITISPSFAQHSALLGTGNSKTTYPLIFPPQLWQWVPPASLDTSEDHVLRPPVA